MTALMVGMILAMGIEQQDAFNLQSLPPGTVCALLDGTPTDCRHPKLEPEPMDVDAAIVSRPCSTRNGKYVACIDVHMEEFTCIDKRRVLLTSEDGGKHCILFPKEMP